MTDAEFLELTHEQQVNRVCWLIALANGSAHLGEGRIETSPQEEWSRFYGNV